MKVGLTSDKASGLATHTSLSLGGGGFGGAGGAMSLMDDDEKQGIAMSSHARVSLMAKLARAEDGLVIEGMT